MLTSFPLNLLCLILFPLALNSFLHIPADFSPWPPRPVDLSHSPSTHTLFCISLTQTMALPAPWRHHQVTPHHHKERQGSESSHNCIFWASHLSVWFCYFYHLQLSLLSNAPKFLASNPDPPYSVVTLALVYTWGSVIGSHIDLSSVLFVKEKTLWAAIAVSFLWCAISYDGFIDKRCQWIAQNNFNDWCCSDSTCELNEPKAMLRVFTAKWPGQEFVTGTRERETKIISK